LDVNAKPVAGAEVEEAILENLMDVLANMNTMVPEDIVFPEENILENPMDGVANVNTLHTDDIFPAAKCVTGGQPLIKLSGLPSSSDSSQESDSYLENERENLTVDSFSPNLRTIVPSNESPTPTPASTAENNDTWSESYHGSKR
jgi:hypothetical protein